MCQNPPDDLWILDAGDYPHLAPAALATLDAVARMMPVLDLLPRLCVILMLTIGGILSESVGLKHPRLAEICNRLPNPST